MAYTKKYGVLMMNQFDTLAELEDTPIHVEHVTYDSASGKFIVMFRPAGKGYPATPNRTKSGVLDDTAPVGGTDGFEMPQWAKARIYIVFNENGVGEQAGTCDVDVWYRGLEGVEDAVGSGKGPWLLSDDDNETGIANNTEIILHELYHREVYLQLTNIAAGTADEVFIFAAGISDYYYRQ
jgi:hypothetical protein